MEIYLLIMTWVVSIGVLFVVITMTVWALESARKGQESLERIIATSDRIVEVVERITATTNRTERITAEILTRLTPPLSPEQ